MNNDQVVVNLGFTFKYFGSNYSEITICENGYVCLGLSDQCWYDEAYLPRDILIGLNYDLDTTRIESGQIYYKSLNESKMASLYVNLLDPSFVPKNIFMITYDNVLPFERSSNSRVSFQIYLLTDSIKSYVIFKYTSCPTDLTLKTSSGLAYKEESDLLGRSIIAKDQHCFNSNVKQDGVWVSEVTFYRWGKINLFIKKKIIYAK
jgi:hypothetical protein